jgi:hypothetical protein
MMDPHAHAYPHHMNDGKHLLYVRHKDVTPLCMSEASVGMVSGQPHTISAHFLQNLGHQM